MKFFEAPKRGALPHSDCVAIVDSDSIVYRIGWVSQNDTEDVALDTLRGFLYESLFKPLKCKQYLFVLSGGRSGRDEVAVTKSYKGTRSDSTKSVHHEALLSYFTEEYKAFTVGEYEADDVVISLADNMRGRFVLCGIDKDALQYPGVHYNYVNKSVKLVSPWEANYNLSYQMLVGDPVDNIQGIYRVGKVKAEAILANAANPTLAVMQAYKDRGLSSDYYQEQLTLLRMKRDIFVPDVLDKLYTYSGLAEDSVVPEGGISFDDFE